MKVFLVRHADAGDRATWQGDDRQRPLSQKGRAQVTGLVRLLAGERVGRIVSSPFIRCVQTVEPLGAAENVGVESLPALAEGSDWHEALALALDARVPMLMCSQGDVIGDFVSNLVARGLVQPEGARAQKASTWVLSVEGKRVTAAEYLPPPRD